MNLDAPTVNRIADVITKTGAVPFPGGHGVHFNDVRQRHRHVADQPGAEARCYVALALLGEEDSDERWNRKEWLPHSAAWFDVYGLDLASRLDAPRWRYLLAGMFTVLERWAGERVSRKHLLPDILECYRLARDRLGAMHRRVGEGGVLCVVGGALPGVRNLPAGTRWDTAAAELCGPDAASVQMLYFMHVLHSSLGVPQHTVDETYPQRLQFYSQLRTILESGGGRTCELCEAGLRIAEALASTAVLNRRGKPSISRATLAASLPSCFQPADEHTRPPLRAAVAARLEHNIAAQQRLLAAHDLAETIADLLMDVVRAGRREVPVFRKSDYGYLLSLIRDGRRRYAAQVMRGALVPSEEDITGPAPVGPRVMSKGFAERMMTDRLVEPARSRLALLADEISWTSRTTSERCAICHVEGRAKG